MAQSFSFFREYELEIERTKQRKVVDASHIYYFDILTRDVYKLAAFCRNEAIIKILDTENYLKEFSLYGNLLKRRVKEAKLRMSLIKKAEIIFNYPKYRLPHFISNAIFEHLRDLDLKYFVETFSAVI